MRGSKGKREEWERDRRGQRKKVERTRMIWILRDFCTTFQ